MTERLNNNKYLLRFLEGSRANCMWSSVKVSGNLSSFADLSWGPQIFKQCGGKWES